MAQQSYSLHINFNPANTSLSKIKAENYPDSLSILRALNQSIIQAQFKGYLLAEITEIKWNNKYAVANINLNKNFRLTKLENGNINETILRQAGYRNKLFINTPLNPVQLQQLFDRLLKIYENNGYPFASVNLDSIKISDSTITAKLYAEPHQLVTLDTLNIAGNARIADSFLQSYLDLKEGSPYNEAAVQALNSRLQELPFVSLVRPPQVNFSDNKAKITLFVNKKNANQFDGLLGFLPGNESNKLQITGDARLILQNVFKHAERIEFNFKGLPRQSRELKLEAGLPGVFSSPIGLTLRFELYKQDTSYLNVNKKMELNYVFRGNNMLRFSINDRSGSIISVASFQNATQLPPFADVSTTLYGLGVSWEKLDYRFNPTKGYAIHADIAAGRKQIHRNSGLPAELYNSIKLNSSQYQIEGGADLFFPLGKQSVFMLGNQTGIMTDSRLFENELYRIGGLRTLRGFDEQSILANRYTIINAEFRYLLERNSFLFVFINQGYARRTIQQTSEKNAPLGFGTGINFETRAGIVSLSYALGKQQNIPLNLQRGKIHFGIITLF